MSEDLSPGTRISNLYEIVEGIGTDDFATYYAAKRLRNGRPVAIKVLAGFGDDPAHRDRFVERAKRAASLRHPNVVTIRDHGFVPPDDLPFLVMEIFEGHTLAIEIAEQGPVEVRRAIPLFTRVLEALAEGHEAGVCHLELRPDNFFVSAPSSTREALMLLNFGIVGLEDVEASLLAGSGIGAAYLAPEFIETQDAGPSADVYQAALVLAEMICGRPVVVGDAQACMTAHVEGALELPAVLLDSPLGPIVRRALQRDPDHRYPNAGDFRRALLEVEHGSLSLDFSGSPLRPVAEVALLEVSAGPARVGAEVQPPPSSEIKSSRGKLPHISVSSTSLKAVTRNDAAAEGPRQVAPKPQVSRTETSGDRASDPAPPAVEEVPRSSKSGLVIGVVAALAVVAAGGVAIWYAFGEGSPEGDGPRSPVATVTGAPAQVDSGSTPAPSVPARADAGGSTDVRVAVVDPDAAVPPTDAAVEIDVLTQAVELDASLGDSPNLFHVVTVPSEATVFRAGREIGFTPFELTVTRATKIIIKKAGYKTERLKLQPGAPERDLRLELQIKRSTTKKLPADGSPADETAEPIGEEAPAAKDEAPAAEEETPAAKEEAPAAKEETPAAKEEAPAAKEEAPAAKEEAPAAKAPPETPPVVTPPGAQ